MFCWPKYLAILLIACTTQAVALKIFGLDAELGGVNRQTTLNSVAMVHISSHKDTLYEERAISGYRTWGADFKHLFYVMEGTREDVTDRFGTCTWWQYGSYPVVQCPNEPQVVMMSACDGQHNGACGKGGPCCKFDHTLKFLRNAPFYSELQWLVFSDDDVYWRKESLLALLNQREPGLASAVVFDDFGTGRQIQGNYSRLCPGVSTSGWFQPTAISKTAMDRLLTAADSGGLTQECKLFQLTHDTALAILFWMYDVDYVEIDRKQWTNLQLKTELKFAPCIQDNFTHAFFDTWTGATGANWSRSVVFHKVKASRCMHNLHRYLQDSAPFTGLFGMQTKTQCSTKCYRDTRHAAAYNVVREFESFKPQDCQHAFTNTTYGGSSFLGVRRHEFNEALNLQFLHKLKTRQWVWSCPKTDT